MWHVLAGAVTIVIGLSVWAESAAATERLRGSWSGTYTCSGIDATMTLELGETDARGFHDGLFHFEMAQGKGSYKVTGRLLPNGSFTFVPQDWIERPAGSSALTIEGSLNPNGLLIEGRLSPCGMGSFKATRAKPETARQAALAPPAPLSGGPFSGEWKGAVECRMNRRGQVETYPLSLRLWQDTGGVGGVAQIRIWKKRGSNGGDAFEQSVLLTGSVKGTALVLDQAILVDDGGASVSLRKIEATLKSDGGIAGSVNLNTCETLSVSRTAASAKSLTPEQMEGAWSGTGGTQDQTVLQLEAIATATGGLLEMRAQWPTSKPEAERDRLTLMLVPVLQVGNRTVAVPVASREATGTFAPDAQRKHVLGQAGAVVMAAESQGGLTLSPVRRSNELAAALGARGPNYALGRPDEAQAAALAVGETPPADLGLAISGSLGSAASREAQCRVLDAWIAPHAAGIDVNKLSPEAVLARLSPAFEDEAFVPVFGLGFLLTSQDERGAVGRLIRETCGRHMGMRTVRIVGDYVLASPDGFTRFATIIANQGETARWRAEIIAAIDALPFDQSGLDRIDGIRRDMRQRRTELSTEERRELEGILDRRTAEMRAAMLLAEAHALPESGTGPEALGSVFALMNRLEQAGLDGGLVQPVRDVAEAKARAILAGPLAQSAEVAASVPASLEGLRLLMAEWNRLEPARAGMDRHFRTVDRDGVLRPVHQRLEGYWSDPGIKEEFRAAMMAVQAGQDPRASVLAAAAQYVDTNRLDRAPGWGGVIEAAILDSEVRALRIVDLSTSPDPGEPTAEEIAAFALDRARAINAEYRQLEKDCLSGRVSDPVMALRCLGVPAVFTGQRGMAARLLSVTKITCETEVAEKQYRCTFIQEIDLAIPGMENLGLDSLLGLARSGTAGEATDARFIRQAGGGWSILWGDLNR